MLTTSEAMLTYDSLGLRVAVGDALTWATQAVAFQCQNLRTWFFTPPPARCPAADAVASTATTQPFEHGFMVWFEASNTYYVFYDGGGADYPSPVVQIAMGPLDTAQAAITPSPVETPPAGMSAPAGDFGRLWRGEVAGVAGVAGGLGWATGPETTYQSDYQCEMSGMMHGWTCYLLGPDGDVLRLWPDSTAQVHILWAPVQ
ncbi:MAG: hypothetical protein IPK16_17265 [Anaerolineales bacterium]|nr:hypothetical protein [Anaerolineales bacterium]